MKIRTISATAPAEDVLTTFKAMPSIVQYGQETEMEFTVLNQLGADISSDVTITCDGDGEFTYTDGKLTMLTAKTVTFTASLRDVELTSAVYAAQAPSVPTFPTVKTAIYSNGINGDNDKVEFTVAYNDGAKKNGTLIFEDGTEAQSFSDTRCIFFSNSKTTGAWNGNILPAKLGYKALHLEVFSANNAKCTIEFEGVENLESGKTHTFELVAGQWNEIEVTIEGATRLNNLSIRFDEANKSDILLTNIYFTPVVDESDEIAPEFNDEVVTTPSEDSVVLKFSAIDRKSEIATLAADDAVTTVTYNITVAGKSYNVTEESGKTVEVTIGGLESGTKYTANLRATDGKNVSSKNVEFTTAGEPTGIENSIIESEGGVIEYYTLQGVKVKGQPTSGIYIVRNGSKTYKTIIR